jgi:hypothetical protein
MGTGTQFDNQVGSATYGQNLSPTFGVINGTRDPRFIQLSLKLFF